MIIPFIEGKGLFKAYVSYEKNNVITDWANLWGTIILQTNGFFWPHPDFLAYIIKQVNQTG